MNQTYLPGSSFTGLPAPQFMVGYPGNYSQFNPGFQHHINPIGLQNAYPYPVQNAYPYPASTSPYVPVPQPALSGRFVPAISPWTAISQWISTLPTFLGQCAPLATTGVPQSAFFPSQVAGNWATPFGAGEHIPAQQYWGGFPGVAAQQFGFPPTVETSPFQAISPSFAPWAQNVPMALTPLPYIARQPVGFATPLGATQGVINSPALH